MEHLRFAGTGYPVPIDPGSPRLQIRGRQQHPLVRRDGPFLRVHPGVTELQSIVTSVTLGDTAGVGAIRIELPDVEFVVDEYLRLIIGPAGDAVTACG